VFPLGSEIEEDISRLLLYGVVSSCALMAAGLAISAFAPADSWAIGLARPAMFAGIILLLITPAARVLLLLRHFARLKDKDYILITLFVLAMMVLGYLAGAA
jgi:uncharacterized membrane protein